MTERAAQPPAAAGAAAGARAAEVERLLRLLADPHGSLSQLVNASPVGISISRASDALILDMNEEFLRILGLTREEAIGRTSFDLNLWVSDDQRAAIIRELRQTGRYPSRPTPMRRKDGAIVTVLFSGSFMQVDGETLALAWVVDITEQLRAEEALRASEARWRALVENAPVTILTVDRSGTILTSNSSRSGRPAREMAGKCIHDFTRDEGERQRSAAILERVFATGQPESFEIEGLGAGGARLRLRAAFAPLEGTGSVKTAIGVAMDITPQTEAAEARRQSDQRFRDLVESMGDWVCETDAGGVVVYCSAQSEAVLGYTPQELLGRPLLTTCAPEERDCCEGFMASLRQSGKPLRNHQCWHLHKSGRRVCLSVSGIPINGSDGAFGGLRAVIHDATAAKREEEERRAMEAEVHHARRVESLGVLAGGIAHDFNNLLTTILGNAEMALASLPGEPPVRQMLQQIQLAGQHAAELTRQMLAYAGRGRLVTGLVDLSKVVHEMTHLLATSVPKKIRLDFELAARLPAVVADAAQLRQVVMNLVINAADAIGEREGRIVVRTGRTSYGLGFVSDLMLGSLDPGCEAVFVDIADTGGGIASEALSRIFDPFFTTKFTGRGLGLAAVQGIVLRHRGAIAVRTDPGAGSTFRVLFPAAEREAASPPASVSAEPSAEPSVQPSAQPSARPAGRDAAPQRGAWRGSGTILFVDDEEPVRNMTVRMLRLLGMEVLEAGDGIEALETVAAHREIRAVLLDQTMPRMDGRETLRELRRLRPALPVILTSGYDVAESAGRPGAAEFDGYLQKPFRLEALVQALRAALGD